MKAKHPTTPHKALVKKYFKKVRNRKWIFYGTQDEKTYHLFRIGDVPIQRHTLVLDKNPY